MEMSAVYCTIKKYKQVHASESYKLQWDSSVWCISAQCGREGGFASIFRISACRLLPKLLSEACCVSAVSETKISPAIHDYAGVYIALLYCSTSRWDTSIFFRK